MFTILNRVTPDSMPDAFAGGLNINNTTLAVICIILILIMIFGSIFIYFYIDSLKEKIEKLEQKNKSKDIENNNS